MRTIKLEKKLTEAEYEARFGGKPVQDDLDRVNCEKAGETGHFHCGVCPNCGLPGFECSGHEMNCIKTMPEEELRKLAVHYFSFLKRDGLESFVMAEKKRCMKLHADEYEDG